MNKYINNYFTVLFCIIPISIILGSTISLINIVLIDLSFVILIIYLKDFSFLKNKDLKYFYLIIIYLLFNSLISLEPSLNISRNLGFVRILIFFLAFNYFFNINFFYRKVFFVWLIVISVVAIDVFFENYFGQNMLGFKSEIIGRNVSFFKDEHIVGGYLFGFYLLLIGHLFDNYGLKYKNFILFFSLILMLAILSTGERSNTIKTLLSCTVFYTLILNYSIKKKLISIAIGSVLLVGIIFSSDWLKLRYFDQIKAMATGNNYYLTIYKSGYEVFKRYPVLGVGNKNYRVETCEKLEELKEIYICTTHPHQIYIEFLSEHGLLGTILLFFIFYKLIFSKIKMVLKSKYKLQLGALIYLFLIFLPLLPSGAFFSDYSLTFFALNISILYATNSKTNIFSVNSNKRI